jgi:hypothetical protein
MGLSIHYKGNLRTKTSLSALIEEVADIAKIYKWKYHVRGTAFPKESLENKKFNGSLYGICFTPPSCETVSICFLSNGQLSSAASSYLFENKLRTAQEILDSWVSVKTQFAGEEIHKMVIHLFDHLNKKYFSDFKLTDEGEYWETRDEKLLHEKFAFLTKMIEKVGGAIEGNFMQPGESIETYFQRILKDIHAQNKPSE